MDHKTIRAIEILDILITKIENIPNFIEKNNEFKDLIKQANKILSEISEKK